MPFPSPLLFPAGILYPGISGSGRAIAISSLTAGVDFTSTALGGRWRGLKLAGWDGSPASSLAVTQRPRDIGGWQSEAFLGSKTGLVLSGMFVGTTPLAAMNAVDALNAAVDLAASALTVADDGIGTRTMVVARQGDIVFTPQPSNLIKVFSIQMVAVDPRKYGPTVSVGPVGPPSVSGGLTFPITFPFTFAATVAVGTASIINPGNIEAPVILQVTGPANGVSILHVWPGGSATWASSLNINTGEYLLIGPDNDQVELMGQATRISSVTQRAYLKLQQGQNDFTYSSSGGTLTVTGPQGAWQ